VAGTQSFELSVEFPLFCNSRIAVKCCGALLKRDSVVQWFNVDQEGSMTAGNSAPSAALFTDGLRMILRQGPKAREESRAGQFTEGRLSARPVLMTASCTEPRAFFSLPT
jgi:hypothetical protein